MDRTRTRAAVWLTGPSKTWRVGWQRTTRCTRTPASYSGYWTCPWPTPPSSAPTSLWEPMYTLLLTRWAYPNDIHSEMVYLWITCILLQTNMTQGQRRRLSNGLVTGHAYSVTGYAQVNGPLNMLKNINDNSILLLTVVKVVWNNKFSQLRLKLHFWIMYLLLHALVRNDIYSRSGCVCVRRIFFFLHCLG